MQLDLLAEKKKTKAAASGKRKDMIPVPLPDVLVKAAAIPGDAGEKSAGAFRTISEAADSLGVPQHVLRFWESRFPQIKPTKLRGGRRYYRPEDMDILTTIQNLLYKQGYTIEGAKKALSQRKKSVAAEKITIEASPIKPTVKPALTDKQQSQLAVIRRELIALKEELEPFI